MSDFGKVQSKIMNRNTQQIATIVETLESSRSIIDRYQLKYDSVPEVFTISKEEFNENWIPAPLFRRVVPRFETVDMVNHPPHYKDGGIEVIDYIEAKGLNYNLGNACKYISRAGKKEGVSKLQDLKKASWYLRREITHGKLT
jgi:hypothetical protein